MKIGKGFPRISGRALKMMAIASLKPYEKNARTHSSEQIKQVIASIKEFGWTNPVLINDKGLILAGHARVEAAKQLGLTDVPCISLDGLTEVQARAYIIADNKLALNAGWDAEILKLELLDLKDLNFDLQLMGFGDKELGAYLQPKREEEHPSGESETVASIAKLGDLFALGRHRLLCGDSSDVNQIEKVLGGEKPELLLYDPPYEVEESWTWAYPCERALIFTDYKHLAEAWSVASKFPKTMQFIWDYEVPQFTPARPLQRHRSCLYASGDARWIADRAIYLDGKERKPYSRGKTRWGDYHFDPLPNRCTYLSTIYSEAYKEAVIAKGLHGKPVDWIRCLIGGGGAKTVLDEFCGSGTSVIAAPEDVTVYAIELDPRKVDGILARWERYMRSKAQLISLDTPSKAGRRASTRPSRGRRAAGSGYSAEIPIV
jgi:hypothetical protein